jgi:DNA polymerase III delta prime subunit
MIALDYGLETLRGVKESLARCDDEISKILARIAARYGEEKAEEIKKMMEEKWKKEEEERKKNKITIVIG